MRSEPRIHGDRHSLLALPPVDQLPIMDTRIKTASNSQRPLEHRDKPTVHSVRAFRFFTACIFVFILIIVYCLIVGCLRFTFHRFILLYERDFVIVNAIECDSWGAAVRVQCLRYQRACEEVDLPQFHARFVQRVDDRPFGVETLTFLSYHTPLVFLNSRDDQTRISQRIMYQIVLHCIKRIGFSVVRTNNTVNHSLL
jgi:hypothetical protein